MQQVYPLYAVGQTWWNPCTTRQTWCNPYTIGKTRCNSCTGGQTRCNPCTIGQTICNPCTAGQTRCLEEFCETFLLVDIRPGYWTTWKSYHGGQTWWSATCIKWWRSLNCMKLVLSGSGFISQGLVVRTSDLISLEKGSTLDVSLTWSMSDGMHSKYLTFASCLLL